nr:leucine-rich repeat protein [uncultured Ruminococcus sp.]
MKRVIKRAVSFVLVFMTVFSVFTILPSEVFHTAYVKAAEMFSSETGASTQETYTTDDFTYTLIDEYSKVQILSYIGSDTDVVIPDRIDNKKVTSIADSAFREKSITSVVFGQYVESIGNYAFYSCQSLNKLDFSKSSVKTIGDCAFTVCKSLESIEFPESLESIGYGAFSAYTDGYGGYYGSYVASSLKSVKFGGGLKSIESYAFYENRALNTVKFTGDALTSIGYRSFYNTDITELDLSGANASIGTYAFYSCNSLRTVKLSGVNTIESGAFYGCDELVNLEMSDTLTTIEGSAFCSCTSLKTVIFSDSVTTIADGSFTDCTGLESVTIGKGCTSVTASAFTRNVNLVKFDVSEDNESYTSVDGVLYNKEKTAVVCYPKSLSGEYVIPDTVTSIEKAAFENCNKLTKITIGSGVETVNPYAFNQCNLLATVVFKDSDTANKKICERAFYYCGSLTEVDFGNAVTSIGDYAFTICSKIKSLEFPDSLTSIGQFAFSPYTDRTGGTYKESNLESVKFGTGLKTIGNYAFYDDRKISKLEFTGDNLTSIGSYAFYENFALEELSLSGNNATIGDYAFYACNKLKAINLKSGIKSIGAYAFRNCEAVDDIKLCSGLETIYAYAFYNCTGIKTITLPDTLTQIAYSAFERCSSLQSIVIPDNVKGIYENTFTSCKSLKSVSIGKNCATIAPTAFSSTTALEKITVSADNEKYSSVDGALLNKEKTSIILYPKSKSGEFVIPDTVTSIADRAFSSCPNLTKITIGANVESVGAYAFSECIAMTDVVFKDSTIDKKTIGNYAFYNCRALSNINFGNAVTSIGDYAFVMTESLTSIEFPDSLVRIGNYAFSPYSNGYGGSYIEYTTSNLENIKFGSGIKTIGKQAFYKNEKLKSIDLTGSNLTLIDTGAFQNCISLIEINLSGNNLVIESSAFYDDKYLKNVTFGAGIKSIGSNAFYNCLSISELNFFDGLDRIYSDAFRNCKSISLVTLPNTLSSIGNSAFYNCERITSVHIPDKVTEIQGGCFTNCHLLKKVTIGSGCTSISPTAFTGANSIEEIIVEEDNKKYTSVDGVLYNNDKTTLVLYPKGRRGNFTIPDAVTTIAERAFERCNHITGVVIGKNVSKIDRYAFSECFSLKSVSFKDSDDVDKTIGDYAFENCQALSNVDFGNAVTSVGNYAFIMTKSLTSIEFPDSLVSIGNYAFSPFSNGYGGSFGIYVESNLESVKFGSELKSIGEQAFFKNEKLKTVQFTGDKLSIIDYAAFYFCTSLTEVTLSGDDLIIGSNAFKFDTALKSVVLNSGVKTIGSNAFDYCTSLENVNIGNDVERIASNSFYYNTNLKQLVLGKGLNSIDSTAFTGYSNLTVYCYEDTYGHEYAKGMSNVDIKFIHDNYYVVDLKASAVSSNSVTMSWKKPNGYDAIDHYIIYKNGAKYDETTDQTYTDINLKSGEEYVYGVVAVDKEGVISEEKTVRVTPACTSVKSITLPNNKTDIGGLNKIKLTATMESNLSKTGGKGEFQFSRDGKEWKSACNANVQSNGVDYVGYWSLRNVVTGEYSLRFVFTDKDGGQSYKDIKVNVDRTHPAPIDEVTITPMETYISLSWQISVEYDTAIYRIYKRAEDETDFELLSEIRDRDITSYNDNKVQKNVTYYYYIVGTDAYGQESLKYDIVSAGLINDTIPPQFIKMTPASNNYIYGNQPFSVVGNDNVGVAKTALYYSTDPEAPLESWTLIDEHNGSSYSQNIDTTVMPNGVVYVVAKIYDAVGNFTYSPKQRYMCDNQGPEQVKNVKCIAVDGTTATLSWSDVSDDDISYFVVECKQSDGVWKSVSRTSTNLGVNLSGLTPEHDYVYRVIGYDKRSNRGTPSEEITVTTLKDTICPKVTKITPDPGYFKSEINLRFTAEDDYRVKSIEIQTSTDKESWKTVSEIKATGESAKCTFDCKLDLKNYEEGSVFVRAKVYDSYGNVTEDKDLTCYEYVVDRTAPIQPTGVTASSGETEGGSSFVNISWNAITDDNSFAYYRVYKSNSADGEFTLLKNNVKTVNTYDENVDFSATYYYKVEAVDLAGNVGKQSGVVSCKVKDDTEKPVIYDLSPVDGTRIGNNNNSVTVAASDNAKLSNLKIEYKTNGLFSSYQTIKEIAGNSKNNCTATIALPLDELNSGTEVTIKVTASDSSGNQADEKIATYTIDKDAPKIKDVKLVEKDDNIFSLVWSCDADDLSHFYIYRKRANDKSYVLYDSVMAESGKNSYTYNDNEIAVSDKSVIYKIEAFDKAKNSSSAESELVKVSGIIAPVPVLDCQSTVVVGSEYMFDATGSTDDTEIVSYSFDFGDGTAVVKNEKGKTLHIFDKTGKCKVTVSVTDSDGNTAKLTKEITVTSRELVGTVNVLLKDEKGNVLPNTDAYMDLGEEEQQHAFTDSNGLAVFEAPIGTHIVSSYKKDYLPVKQNISVTGKETCVTLVLVNEPIVTAEFEIHKMTFDEIVAAGIDINAAENRNVVKINVTLHYEREPIHSVIYWNGKTAKSDPIYVKTSSGTRKLTPCVIGSSNSSLTKAEDPTIVYLDVPVEFSYLKEFFSVSLHIINHASSDFSLLDNTVTLNVPDGLSVVKTNSLEPKASVYIDEIKGQTQKTIKWILRGDKAGTYDISADFLGMLSYFNEPISAKFVADNPIEVHNASTIDVEIEAADHNYGSKVFYNIIVENKGDFALEGFKWEKLNESYCDEYVDANGNSYEMDKQCTTLNPGEKYVYHCFTKPKGSLSYLKSVIEDVASTGANASVSVHEVKYFLEKYYEKFPEEGGAYVFYIQDKDGNPISGATVELNSEFTRTSDREGKVVIDKDERFDIESSYLKVTASNYYTYKDDSFAGLLFGSNTKIKLYRVGEYAVASVKVDGADALKSKASIQTNAKNKDGSAASVTFIAKIYGEISSVDVVQNDKTLTAKSKNINSDEYIYTNTYIASDFEKSKPVYLYVTLKSGKIEKTALNVSSVMLTYQDVSIELPESTSITIDNSPFEFMNGASFEFSLTSGKSMGLSWQYDKDEDALVCAVNFDANKGLGGKDDDKKDENEKDDEKKEDDKKENDKKENNKSEGDKDSDKNDEKTDGDNSGGSSLDANDDFATLKDGHFSDMVELCKKQYEDILAKKRPSNNGEPNFNFQVQGALEFKIKDDGTLALSKSKLYLAVSISREWGSQFTLGFVPITASITFSYGMGAEASFVYNDVNKTFSIDSFELAIRAALEIKAGFGIKCLSAGLYGSADLGFDIDIKDAFELKKVELSGELGVYIKLFFYTDKFKIVSGTATLYERDSKAKAKAYSELVAAAYDVDKYNINDKLLSYNSGWNDEIESGNGNTALLDNAYSASKPQIAACGDKAVMVYQSVDENATNSANALALYYSVYDSTTGKWSKASKLDDNKNADISYSLAVSGDQIYLVYAQSNTELLEDSSITDTVKNIDVYSAKFSFWSNKFENFTRISNNSTYDANPVFKDINGVPTAIWMNSSSNNPFFNDSSNSIMMSSLANGTWSQPQAVAQNVDTVINCDIIESSKSKYVVYTCDKDGDLSTTDDKTICVCNTATGETNVIAENVETAISTGEVLNKSVVVWYENGTLMQYDVQSKAKAEICNISGSAANGVEIVNDENGNCAIVYTESKNKINALYLDTASGTWSNPVTLVSSDNYIENVEPVYINGKLTFTYYDSKVIDDDMNTESKLVTTIADSVSKPVITDASVDYSEINAGKEAKADVSVTNNSFEPTGNLTFTVKNYDGTVLGTYTTTDKSLSAGASETFSVPFTSPEQIVNRCITITVTDSKAKYTSSYDIPLGYTDMAVSAEQYIDGDENFIKAVVYNRFSYDSPATLEVYNRNTNEVYFTQNIPFVSKNTPVTITVPLDKSYVDDTGFVSVRVISKANDYNDFNNTYMFEYYNMDIPDNMILMGDTTLDRRIDVSDATFVQKHIVKLENLTNNALIAADVDRDNTISIKDATLIQCYVAKFENCGYCGTYVDPSQLPTVPATEPTTETPATEPVTEPSTEVTTAPVTEPTVPTTQPTTVAPTTKPTTVGKSYVYAKGYTHAYFWNSDATDMAGKWPGKAMESVGDGVYRIAVPTGATNVVFSNKGENQTADLTVNVGKIYSNGNWTNYSVEPTTAPTTVYVYAKGYTYAYFWNSTATDMAGKWPGKAMESVGDGVYRIAVPTGATNVIFSNNGANQTADLTVNVGKIYSNGNWSAYNP